MSESPVHVALVTGATGCLGLNLVEQLLAARWRVWALHRPSSDLRELARFDAARIAVDLTDRDALLRAIPPGVRVIFHAAADTSMGNHRERQWRVNVGGTENVIALAQEQGARLVHTSTWATFGLEHTDIDETTPPTGARSAVPYVRSKWQAEERVRAAAHDGLWATLVHPAHIVGRYDTRNWVRLLHNVACSRRPWVPPGFGSYCHAEAVAKAHIAAAERAHPGRSYLLGGADATFAEVARTLGRVQGRCVKPRVIPAGALRAVARAETALFPLVGLEPRLTEPAVETLVSHARVVSHRAEHELDYRPVSLAHMLADAWSWWSRHPN